MPGPQSAVEVIALPPGIKSQEGVSAIVTFLAKAFEDPKRPGQAKDIRWVDDAQGKRWWQLSDVCEALEISNSRNVKKRIPAVFLTTVHSVDGGPARTFIDISGVSQLILESRKPEAQPYKAFINGVVVPEVYATGGYQPKGLADLAENEAITQAVNAPLPPEAQQPLSITSILSAMDEAALVARRCKLKGDARRKLILELAGKANGINLKAMVGRASAKPKSKAALPLVAPVTSKVSTNQVDKPAPFFTLDDLVSRLGARSGTIRNWAHQLGIKPTVGPKRAHLYSEADLSQLASAKDLFDKGYTAIAVRKAISGGQPEPPPPTVENHLNATSLGQRLIPRRSPQEVNQALEALGLIKRHYPNSPLKSHEWHLTPEGAARGGRVFQVDKEHGQGVVEQIRWAASGIIPQLSKHFEV